MKIPAGQALVAFGEMKIDRADETGERTNDAKGKERDNGPRKYAGHLVVPKWKSRKSQSRRRHRSRSAGPYDRSCRPKSSRKKIRRNSLSTFDFAKQVDELRADVFVPP
ncbi:hypothetical protein V495_04465 [Pseudogymnoascus sp. VKM F-4514 (FW-929)]|nr:hypothetical protein V495_04465 [Pseudogymnoascus sp. VKM F-4514 (FW-929)]KFY57550.1 hypothetical protein V497_05475 [Pseudogymnoascus sp. VKM F-4516 (FW-969)]